MQQELIEMLDKMVKYFDEISSDSYYYRETAAILNEAEKLVEKAKNSVKEPAVPQGEPVYQLAKLGGPTETAWIDVTQEVYEDAGFYKDDFKRRILYATPAPAPAVPEIDYEALIHAAFAKNAKWAQGTAGCIAFARGAEWFRDQMLAAALREKEQAK